MITSQEYEGRTVFFVTEKEEWKDLTAKGHVVYRQEETVLVGEYPELFDEALRGFLFRSKLLLPKTRVYAVRSA